MIQSRDNCQTYISCKHLTTLSGTLFPGFCRMSRCVDGLIDLERSSLGGSFFRLPENTVDFHTVNHVMLCMVEMSPNSVWVKPVLPSRSMLWYFFDVKQSFKYFSHFNSICRVPSLKVNSINLPWHGKILPIQNQVQLNINF